MRKGNKYFINIKQLLPITYLYKKKYKKYVYLLYIFDFIIWMIPFALISMLLIINLLNLIKNKNNLYAQKKSKNF